MLKVFLDMAGKYGLVRTVFAFGILAVALGCGLLSAVVSDPIGMWHQFFGSPVIPWWNILAVILVICAIGVWGDIVWHWIKNRGQSE